MKISGNLFLVGLWLFLCGACWSIRPILPIDETRYVSVAWEMWQRGDFLVPHLNGLPYSHKPPLLFWLIHLGWAVFGVNSWWPRMVPALFGLGSLFLTRHMARALWPERDGIAELSPFILLGSFLWAIFDTLLMFDVLIVFLTMLSILGLISFLNRGRGSGLLLMGLGMGFGILAKGPVIFAHVLPMAVLAPFWRPGRLRPAQWMQRYAKILVSLVGAAGIGLLWAIPAARSGGPEYSDAILWSQTAGRVVRSFAHGQPWWWYLPVLPLLIFPWILNGALWRGLGKVRPSEFGVRFCLSWIAAVVAVFSMISGKQIYYLLPLVPVFSMLVGRILDPIPVRRSDPVPFAVLIGGIGAAWLVLPYLENLLRLPEWTANFSIFIGLLYLATGAAIVVFPARNRSDSVLKFSAAAVLAVVLFNTGFFTAAGKWYNVRNTALYIRQLQNKGYPVAYVNGYDGQFQFTGRLSHPLEEISKSEMHQWLNDHPDGRTVRKYREPPTDQEVNAEYVHPYRGGFIVILAPPAAPSPKPH